MIKMVDLDKQYPLIHDRTTSLIGKREIRKRFFKSWRVA